MPCCSIHADWGYFRISQRVTRADLVSSLAYSVLLAPLAWLLPLLIVSAVVTSSGIAPPVAAILPAVVALLLLVRRLLFRPVAYRTLGCLMRQYGPVRGLAAHVLFQYGQSAVQTLGSLVGYFRHRHEMLVMPRATRVTILNRLDSLTPRIVHGNGVRAVSASIET